MVVRLSFFSFLPSLILFRRARLIEEVLDCAAFTDALESLDAVGIPLLLGSRLIPKDVVEQKSNELSDFLAQSHSPSIVHLGALFPSSSAVGKKGD